MIQEIGEAATLEQLAEECTELAKAALKKARIIRGENPTPVTLKESDAALREEWTDVVTCAVYELEIRFDKNLYEAKQKRFQERWKSKISE